MQIFHLVPAVIASLARIRKKKPENAKRILANFRYIESSQLEWISGFTRQPYVSPMTLSRLADRGALGSLKK